jgi:hypothetical protein
VTLLYQHTSFGDIDLSIGLANIFVTTCRGPAALTHMGGPFFSLSLQEDGMVTAFDVFEKLQRKRSWLTVVSFLVIPPRNKMMKREKSPQKWKLYASWTANTSTLSHPCSTNHNILSYSFGSSAKDEETASRISHVRLSNSHPFSCLRFEKNV